MVQENGVPVGMKHYPAEFKADAVALYRSRPGATIKSVAADLGANRRRPESVLGDKAYDSCAVHPELRRRRILPVISRRGAPNIKGLGKLRYVVEQTFALLHQFKRLAVRWERRLDLHTAFVSLGCGLICWRQLKKAAGRRSRRPPWRHALL
jgi:transposase